MSEESHTPVWKSITNNIVKVIVGLLLLSVVLNTALGLAVWFQAPLWNPFGDYPEQEVVIPEQDVTLQGPVGPEYRLFPTIYYTPGEDIIVPVQGTKCVTYEGSFRIEGRISYEITYPDDIIISGSKGEGKRNHGCETRKFDNKLPEDVVQRIDQFIGPNQPIVMKIKGSETAFAENGDEGAVQSWETEEFAIVLKPALNDE